MRVIENDFCIEKREEKMMDIRLKVGGKSRKQFG